MCTSVLSVTLEKCRCVYVCLSVFYITGEKCRCVYVCLSVLSVTRVCSNWTAGLFWRKYSTEWTWMETASSAEMNLTSSMRELVEKFVMMQRGGSYRVRVGEGRVIQ